MSSPTSQDVIDKIKKLLKVDETRGNSQAEAEQALMAAQRLAVRHGIDLNEIDTAEDIEPPEPIVGEDFTPERTGGGQCVARLPTSHKYVSWILERYFRVQIIYVTSWREYEDKGIKKEGRVRTLQLFGKKTNVQIAMYVYGFLHREFSQLWREHKRKTDAPLSSRNSFFFGLYVGLDSKLKETMGQIEKETARQLESKGTSMAMVLVGEKEKIDAEVAAVHPRLVYINQHEGPLEDYDAIHAGREKGEKINIKTSLK